MIHAVIQQQFWVKNWHFRGSKHTLTPSYIFSGSQEPPTPDLRPCQAIGGAWADGIYFPIIEWQGLKWPITALYAVIFLVLSFTLVLVLRWYFHFPCRFSFGSIFVLVLTFLYVKYGRRHYLCGHVYCTYWYIPTKIANATQFAVRRVA